MLAAGTTHTREFHAHIKLRLIQRGVRDLRLRVAMST